MAGLVLSTQPQYLVNVVKTSPRFGPRRAALPE